MSAELLGEYESVPVTAGGVLTRLVDGQIELVRVPELQLPIPGVDDNADQLRFDGMPDLESQARDEL